MIPTFISFFAFILMFGKTGWITQLLQRGLGFSSILTLGK
jgi:ABC-type Fe3+ transport system permease subunit